MDGALGSKEYERAVAEITDIVSLLESPVTTVPVDADPVASKWKSNIGKEGYETFVSKVKGIPNI
jgi:hypothetical protein